MNQRIFPLHLEFFPASQPVPMESGVHLLGRVSFGDKCPAPIDGIDLLVPLDPLDSEPVSEVWTTDQKPTRGACAGFETAETNELLFGAAKLDCEDPEAAAQELYGNLFEVLRERDFANLLRIWNIVPRIGEDRGGLDRYMHFCRGRALAFEARHGQGFESLLPAASAVGSDRGPFIIWFIASKRAGVPRENPRQISAFQYPDRYGPKPPSFARATLTPQCLGAELLLSGTASILGSESVHLNDTSAQLAETMENLRALLGKNGRIDSNHLKQLKVFVRDRSDYIEIRDSLTPLIQSGTQMMFLRADICRPELLLEIEGLAVQAPASVNTPDTLPVAY